MGRRPVAASVRSSVGVDVFREPHGSFGERTREVLYERADTGDVETTISVAEPSRTR